MDARQARDLGYPLVIQLHKFMIAVSRDQVAIAEPPWLHRCKTSNQVRFVAFVIISVALLSAHLDFDW